MDTFLKFLGVATGIILSIVFCLTLVGLVVRRCTMAAKEVIDYYLQKKKEVIAEMEEEFAVGAKKDFGSH